MQRKADRQQKQLVVLGGGYAGLMAAARAVMGDPAVQVTLVDARPEFVQRIRLHELLAGRRPKSRRYAALLERRGIRFVQGRVERLDPERRYVSGRDGSGRPFELEYDALVLALGSRTAAGKPGAAEHTLRLDDPAEIARTGRPLPELARKGGRVLVVGGGLTGIEAAAETAERYPGLRVAMVTTGALGQGFSSAAADYFRQRFARLGVEVHEHAAVEEVKEREARLTDGRALPFDLCIWAAGFTVPSLAREAGLEVDRDGRVVVDETLRSVSHPEVFAAGDAAVARVGELTVRMGCVSAMPLGAHAGENAARFLRGEAGAAFDFGFTIRCVSLGRRDGLVQFTDPVDRPQPQVWTGLQAVLVKELICRMTYAVPQWELKLGRALYRWPGAPKPELRTAAAAERQQESCG